MRIMKINRLHEVHTLGIVAAYDRYNMSQMRQSVRSDSRNQIRQTDAEMQHRSLESGNEKK